MMRLADNQDVDDILTALRALWAKSQAAHMVMVDPMEAELSVRHAIHQGRGWFMGPYFIMVESGKDWFCSRKFLIEQIIIRCLPKFGGDPSLEDVIRQGLPHLAAYYGCSAIIVGDSQVGFMVPHYEAAGYRHVGVQLMKETP